MRLALLFAALLCSAPSSAFAGGAGRADAQSLLDKARRAARPPSIEGSRLRLQYAATWQPSHQEARWLADLTLHVHDDGRYRSTVRSAAGEEIRFEDGHSRWYRLTPGTRMGPVEEVAKALNVGATLRRFQEPSLRSSKAGKASGTPILKLRFGGSGEGAGSLNLDARTGDLLKVRAKGRLAPSSVSYSDWRPLGRGRIPGRVVVDWGHGRAVASLEAAELQLGSSAEDDRPPADSLSGRNPASCSTWRAPVMVPGDRLQDLLWDHARPAPGLESASSLGDGGRGYAMIDAPDGSGGQVIKSFDGNEDMRMSQSGLAAPADDETDSSTSVDAQGRLVHRLGSGPRRKSERLPSQWRVIARIAADGTLGPTAVVQGPSAGEAVAIPPLSQFLSFEPARCDGKPVDAWHEFDLTWPLSR